MMLGVSLLHPLEIMYSSNAFSTPLEIVTEWVLPAQLQPSTNHPMEVTGGTINDSLNHPNAQYMSYRESEYLQQSLQKTYHDQLKPGIFSIWTMAW